MSLVNLAHDPRQLQGKTVVISGGASGIGEGYVRFARQNGANVFFGDVDSVLGEKVASETGATFLRTDVTVYKDQVRLFRQAWEKHSRIDHAVANAGVYEPEGWFDPNLDLTGVEKEPSSLVFDVNIRGEAIFAHLASVFLAQGRSPGQDRSLTIISSAAAIQPSPLQPLYSTSKAAEVALARSLAQKLPKSHGIRVNTICPSIMRTPLAIRMGVLPTFEAAGVPVQSAGDVAEIMVGVNCDSTMNGKVLYVMAGKAYDIEAGTQRTMPEWLGPEIVELNGRIREAKAILEAKGGNY